MQCICLVAQSCLTICDSLDRGLPDSSVHGIFQAIVLEWVAISFSNPGLEPRSPALQVQSLLSEPPGKPVCMHIYIVISIYSLI